MTPEERRAIEWDCQKLALRFTALNDAQDYDALASLFTENGEFARPTDPDNPVQGRDAILAAFKARPSDRITRHICTNIEVEAVSRDRANGRMYVFLITGDAGEAAAHGINAAPRRLMGEFRDEYVRTPDGWRIARRTGTVTFTIE